MDIDRARYFKVFAETGSLVRASEILHISQPALSKALRILEAETGLKLVEADGRGLRLTEAGEQFRAEITPLLSQWMGLSKKIRDREEWKPTRITTFEVFSTHFIHALAKSIDLQNLELLEFGPGKMEDAVASGRADLGITYLPVPRKGVEFLEVGKIKMGVYGVDKFRKEAFGDLPFVVPLLPAEGTPSKVIGLDGWPDHKVERNIRFRVTMMESALELCRVGRAVAYLPEFVVSIHNQKLLSDYRLRELEAPLGQRERLQSVFLISADGAGETNIHRAIAKCIRGLS